MLRQAAASATTKTAAGNNSGKDVKGHGLSVCFPSAPVCFTCIKNLPAAALTLARTTCRLNFRGFACYLVPDE